MPKDERVTFVVSTELKEKLEAVTDEFGLSKAEVARRGLVEEVSELYSQIDRGA